MQATRAPLSVLALIAAVLVATVCSTAGGVPEARAREASAGYLIQANGSPSARAAVERTGDDSLATVSSAGPTFEGLVKPEPMTTDTRIEDE